MKKIILIIAIVIVAMAATAQIEEFETDTFEVIPMVIVLDTVYHPDIKSLYFSEQILKIKEREEQFISAEQSETDTVLFYDEFQLALNTLLQLDCDLKKLFIRVDSIEIDTALVNLQISEIEIWQAKILSDTKIKEPITDKWKNENKKLIRLKKLIKQIK